MFVAIVATAIVVADLSSAVIVVLVVAVVVFVVHYTRRLCVSQRDEMWDADEKGVRGHVAQLDLNFEASVAWVE